MAESLESLAKRTRKERCLLHLLTIEGGNEREALLKVMPEDSNRSRKLKIWRDKGLFPVPEEELQEYYADLSEKDTVRTTTVAEHTSPEMAEDTSDLVRVEVISPEAEGVRTSPEDETMMESQETQDPELVAPTTQTTSDVLGGLVWGNPEEITTMLDELLALHRTGKLAELGKDRIDTPSAPPLPPMPRLSAKPLSIYTNENLRKMAERKAQNDPNLPAGTTWNRSTLTSYLLWEYLGFPSAEEIENWSGE